MERAKTNKRIGFIARCDDTGLGVESMEFVEHVKPDKIMTLMIGYKKQHPERFPGSTVIKGVPSEHEIRTWLEGLDVVFAIETGYHPFFFSICHRAGVKTILRVNYEYLDVCTGINRPDLFLLPTPWHEADVPNPKKVLPFPINTDRVKAREIKTAQTFVHIAGHRGYMDRNGTELFLRAIPLVKSPAKFIIYDQAGGLKTKDKRAEIRGEAKHYWDMYADGDVLVIPRKHSGQCLPMREAMAAGMPTLMTDMDPQNKTLDPEWLIPIRRELSVDIKKRIEYADIDPAKVAQKIDEWYNKNIWQTSSKLIKKAQSENWTALLPEYLKLLQNL
jgi:glycosyltransferase involved in cell wall biosynthesis